MENFKDITEHQLEAGEIGIYGGLTYRAFDNLSSGYPMCHKCDLVADCSTALCDTCNIYFKRYTVYNDDYTAPDLEDITPIPDDNTATICCERFKEFIPLFSWFTSNDDTLIMPNVDGNRVQYCPSCGKYIRDIQLSKRDSLQYFK